MNVLRTKLFTPPLRPFIVQRTRLLEVLNQSLSQHCKITILSAPAGSGKTTLLAHWLREQARSAAWISLDSTDNDPYQFVTYLLATLQQVDPALDDSILQSLGPEMESIDATLLILVNELTSFLHPFSLILDDYHVIENSVLHSAIVFLIENLPPHVHLVVGTRSDPPFPLANLRAKGQMVEIRASDLRFTLPESTSFLNETMGLKLTSDQVAGLEARTEGWVAGLQLAAASLRSQKNIDQFIENFAGTHHFVLDYLLNEVLRSQSEERYSFLLNTSILDRLTGALCDALTGQHNGQATLEQLEHENLFVLPLDDERKWYRYHHLLSDLLKHRLSQERPDKFAELHFYASDWYLQNGFTKDAIEHMLAAKSFEQAAALIEKAVMPMLQRGRQFTLERWIDSLPKAVLSQRPQLLLLHAWVLLFTGKVELYEQPLQAAERIWEAEGRQDHLGQIWAFRANVARLQKDPSRAIQLAEKALEWLPNDARLQRGICAMVLGDAYVQTGNVKHARAPLETVLRWEQGSENRLLVLISKNRLADAAILEGRLHQAAEIYQDVLESVGNRPIWQRAEAHVGLGQLHLEWNKWQEAKHHLSQALAIAEATHRQVYLADGYVALAWLHHYQSDEEQAIADIQHALSLAEQFEHRNSVRRISAQEALIRLRQGDQVSAGYWLKRHAPDSNRHLDEYLYEAEFLTAVRIWMADGKYTTAQQIITTLKSKTDAAGRQGRLIELLMLESLLLHYEGQQEAALESLQEALTLAAPSGYIRIFIDEGEPIADLLHQLATQDFMPHYVAKLLDAARVVQSSSSDVQQSLIEPLTKREIEVLSLMAQGASNQEIARELTIALTTTKKHVSNIIGKLGAQNRTEAVSRGRELHLI